MVTTKACVSPLVNNADPCVLSKIPTSHFIGLTVLVSLPSIRLPVFKSSPLTISFSINLIASLTITGDKVSDTNFSEIKFLMVFNSSVLFCFSLIL